MQRIVPLLMLLAYCTFASAQNPEDLPKYESRYDYLDLDAIVENKRLVKNYADCLLNVRPCSPEGKALKRILPEALRTKCARCTEKQKAKAINVIKRLKKDYPEIWEKLSKRWDPYGDFNRYFDEVVLKNATLNGGDLTSQSGPQPSGENLPSPPIIPDLSNRFGDDDDTVSSSPSNEQPVSSIRPIVMITTPRPYPIPGSLPTVMTYTPRVAIVPIATPSLPPPYANTVTLIDHFGTKLIRTTELITDIMLNSVRAFLGR